MLTRRELVVAGGLAFAGHLLPSSLRAWYASGSPAEIAMRAAGGGARVWFDPIGLLVPPRTRVRWVLVDGVHTATAYHPANGDRPSRIPEGAEPWDSGYLVEAGATYEVDLEIEGVYDYFCRPHEAAGMAGRIVVSSDPASGSGSEPRTPDARSPSPPRGDGRLPTAVLDVLPAVDEILRRGEIRAGVDPR